MVDDQSGEDGSRKRVRLTQTEWQGKSYFGNQPDSLRVAASTAASIRTFRPSLMDSSAIGGELGPRAPTPRPTEKRLKPTNIGQNPSGLRRASSLCEYQVPGLLSDGSVYDDQASMAGSSPDIPSSPPCFDHHDNYQNHPSPPSPQLPELPLHHDSGFQSDLPTDVINSDLPGNETTESRAKTVKKWRETRLKRNATMEWSTYDPTQHAMSDAPPAPTPPSQQLPVEQAVVSHSRAMNAIGIATTATTKTTTTKPAARKSRAKKQKVANPEPSQPLPSIEQPQDTTRKQGGRESPPSTAAATRAPSADVTQVPSLPTLPQDLLDVATADGRQLLPRDPVPNAGPMSGHIPLPPRNVNSKQGQGSRGPSFSRSQTWAGPSSDIEGSELPPSELDAHGNPRTGSGAIRRRTIQKNLQSAVATGQPVRFCENCGAIDTPTWRPYFVRVESGTGEDVVCDAATGIHCWHPVIKDDEGKVLTYRIFKQWTSMTSEERNGMFEKLWFCNRKLNADCSRTKY
jgi:hypothetical protein